MPSTYPRPLAMLAVTALCLCVPVHAAQNPAPSQPQPVRPAPVAPVTPKAAPAAPVQFVTEDDDRGARETREAFYRLLERHPPSVGRVLKLDPTLMESPEYLATYPAIGGFLAAHPDVARNPSFFLDRVNVDGDSNPTDARTQAFRMWQNVMDGVAVFVVLTTVISSLMWLIRTLIDYRRWARLTRVQQEVHTKLLDRFTNNDDLLAYMRTPAGERFLESAPISLDGDARPMAAPLRRILMGVQAGLVLLCAGVGMQFVARRIPEEVAAAVSAIGVLAVAVGFGFIASAVASYLLSARLGLITPPPGGPAAEPPARA